jgi:hypothetical protein
MTHLARRAARAAGVILGSGIWTRPTKRQNDKIFTVFFLRHEKWFRIPGGGVRRDRRHPTSKPVTVLGNFSAKVDLYGGDD